MTTRRRVPRRARHPGRARAARGCIWPRRSSSSRRRDACDAAMRAEMAYYREHAHEAADARRARRAAGRVRRAALARARRRGLGRDADGRDPLPRLRRRRAGARRAARARAAARLRLELGLALPEVLERCGLAGIARRRRHLGRGRRAQARPGDLPCRARARRLRARRGAARRRHAATRTSPAPAPPGIPALLIDRDGGGRRCSLARRDRAASPTVTDEPDRSPSQPPPAPASAAPPTSPPTAAADRRRGPLPRARDWGPAGCSAGSRFLIGAGHRRAPAIVLGLRSRRRSASLGARLALQGAARGRADPDRVVFASRADLASSRRSALGLRRPGCGSLRARWRSPTSATSRARS